jgi:hypothetical protein
VKADAGVAFSTGPTAAACDVEGDRYEVADLEVLDVAAFLDHFTGDLMSKHHAGKRGRTAPDHVLVGAADKAPRRRQPARRPPMCCQTRASSTSSPAIWAPRNRASLSQMRRKTAACPRRTNEHAFSGSLPLRDRSSAPLRRPSRQPDANTLRQPWCPRMTLRS